MKKNKQIALDWHSAKLNASTKIDEAYRNTQNVRRFFKSVIGEHFNFTRDFMLYLKTNTGITLAEAAQYWKKMNASK